jgi:hypothetical protein
MSVNTWDVLYYKNMETKCMYDTGFSGPCLEKNGRY